MSSDKYQHFFDKLEKDRMLVNDISSLGWGFWPSNGGGYMDEHILRVLADEIERRNKPFWDEYDRYCEELEKRRDDPYYEDDLSEFEHAPAKLAS